MKKAENFFSLEKQLSQLPYREIANQLILCQKALLKEKNSLLPLKKIKKNLEAEQKRRIQTFLLPRQ